MDGSVSDAGPLHELRVVCLAEQYPGPYATLLLADLGAEVIVVERPGGGDPARSFPAFHESLNRNKKSVVLDLKQSAGVEALRRLAVTADVFIEGFRPGTADRLGFGHEALRGVSPRLVYVSISGFGQDGPHRLRPAHDLSFQAAAGLLGGVSVPDSGVPGGVAIADLTAGLFTTVGALAALRAREADDTGSFVDVSMMDCLISLMTSQLGPLLNQEPNSWLDTEPGYGVYHTLDGPLTLSISVEEHFWRALCAELDLPEAERMDVPTRRRHCVSLRTQIAERLSQHTRIHWSNVFDRAGIPFGLVNDLPDVIADAQVQARGLLVTVPDDGERPQRYHVRQPLKIDGRAYGPAAHVPRLGKHTHEVLVEAGFTADEIRSLFDSGAAGTSFDATS